MKLKLFTCILGVAVCSLSIAQTRPAGGDDYPNRPMRIIVPYPPGGINDNVARLVGQRLAETYKQPAIVDNRAGAGTIIGTDAVAKAPADGYTVLLSSTANSVNVSLYEKLPYDPLKAFTHVSLALTTPYVMVVESNVPAKTLRDLIALARSKPGSLAYATAGNGSGSHLMAEMLAQYAQINMLHVPYKGMAPAITDVLGGQAQILFASFSTLSPHITSGRLRALAATGKRRIEALPEIPTIAESGYSEYEGVFWVGFSVPAGTPRPIVDKLSRDIGVIMRAPDVRTRYSSDAAETVGSTPEEFNAYFNADVARWTKVIRSGNIKP